MSEVSPNRPEANHCGTCTMCCKLLGIIELDKAAGQWCTHCAIGTGCKIYDTRPADCRTYMCVWRDFREQGHPIPEELRPDRCGVIIDAALNGRDHYVRVDATKPDAWKKPIVQAFVKNLFEVGTVSLVVGNVKRTIRMVGR